jgi:hypothetical protein
MSYSKKMSDNDFIEQIRREQTKSLEEKMMKMILDTGKVNKNSFRVIAKFGESIYDFTITRREEINLVQALLDRFEFHTNEANKQDKTTE